MPKMSINTMLKNQLAVVRKKISQEEKTLQSLREDEKNIQRAAVLLGGRRPAGRRRARAAKTTRRRKAAPRRAGRKRRTDWDKAIQKLPPAFSMDELAGSPGARGKSRAYLHQIINRWKKAGVIKSTGRATYQKVR